MIEIEILRAGTHTASNGVCVSFSKKDLEKIARNYNPNHFKAPLIISHNTEGILDNQLAHSELAYGYPKYLKVVGDRLKAICECVAPELKQWWKEGRLFSVSSSIYLPDSPTNPYPGEPSLRHVALLGTSPPAIKGLEAIALREPEQGILSFSADFSEELIVELMGRKPGTTKAVETEPDFAEPFDVSAADLFTRIREFLISKFDTETADSVLPPDALSSLRMMAMSPEIDTSHMEIESLRQQVDSLQEAIASMAVTPCSPTSPSLPYTDYAESEKAKPKATVLSKQLTKLMADADIDATAAAEVTEIPEDQIKGFLDGSIEPDDEQLLAIADVLGVDVAEIKPAKKPVNKEAVALQEQLAIALAEIENAKQQTIAAKQQLKKQEIASFTEALIRTGQLLPHSAGSRVVEFGEEVAELNMMDFMLSLDERQLVFFKDFLSTQPNQVDYSEIATPTIDEPEVVVEFVAVDGYGVSSSRHADYQKIVNYCARHNLDPSNADHFSQAANALFNKEE